MEQHLLNNKRESVLLGTKISFALIAVALVMGICYTIGICSVLETKSSFMANATFLAAYIILVCSITLGGLGIDQVRHDLFNNKFNLKSDNEYFNHQASSLLYSLFFFFAGILIHSHS